jgi:hypothetical protein
LIQKRHHGIAEHGRNIGEVYAVLCRFIAFFVSSHVNFIGNSVYTLCIYVKGVLISISSNVSGLQPPEPKANGEAHATQDGNTLFLDAV